MAAEKYSLPALKDFETRAFADKSFALITGASSGIGLELAKIARQRGWSLVLVSADAERLAHAQETVAGIHAPREGQESIAFAANLANAKTRQELMDEVAARGLTIDLLVNCAGFTAHGPVAESDPGKLESVLEINAAATLALCRNFLPGMLARGTGRILNVASTAAFRPSPFQAVYYAAKAFALNFSEGLAEELEGSPVTVTCLCPGATDTAFFKRAEIEIPKAAESSLMSARDAALCGFKAMLEGRRLIVPGLRNKIQAFAVRFLPRGVVLRIMRKVMAPVKRQSP